MEEKKRGLIESRIKELKASMDGTPLWSRLEKIQDRCAHSSDKPVLIKFTGKYQVNPRSALNYLSKTLQNSFLGSKEITGIVYSPFWDSGDDPWRECETIFNSGDLQKVDLYLSAGRLAQNVGVKSQQFYKNARGLTDELSIRCGMGFAHLGSKDLGVRISSELLSQRKKIIALEGNE